MDLGKAIWAKGRDLLAVSIEVVVEVNKWDQPWRLHSMRTPKATPTFKDYTEEGGPADRKGMHGNRGVEARV